MLNKQVAKIMNPINKLKAKKRHKISQQIQIIYKIKTLKITKQIHLKKLKSNLQAKLVEFILLLTHLNHNLILKTIIITIEIIQIIVMPKIIATKRIKVYLEMQETIS